VLVGLSGGPDSTALLHLLREAAPLFDPRFAIAACHLHHSIRGASADEDERFCREICERLGIPLVVERCDVPAECERRRLSLETAAREARHRFYLDAARRTGAACVALGHHRDDQAETVLFRLLRGTGLRGLRGMPIRRRLAPGESIVLVRPLLPTPRATILAYLDERGISFRRDETNDALDAARNRIRSVLLPAMEATAGRDMRPTLARIAAVAARAQRILERAGTEAERLARADAPRVPRRRAEIHLRRAVLADLGPAVAYEVVGRALARIGAGPLESSQWASLFPQFSGDRRIGRDVRGGARIESVGRDRVRIRRSARGAMPDTKPEGGAMPALELPVPGSCDLPGLGVRLEAEIHEDASTLLGARMTEIFDAGRVALPLRVRTWRDGDRIEIAKGKSKKLQDVFVDAHVPRDERRGVPLVVDAEGRLLWVVGLRRDAATFVETRTEGTGRALVLRAIRSR